MLYSKVPGKTQISRRGVVKMTIFNPVLQKPKVRGILWIMAKDEPRLTALYHSRGQPAHTGKNEMQKMDFFFQKGEIEI